MWHLLPKRGNHPSVLWEVLQRYMHNNFKIIKPHEIIAKPMSSAPKSTSKISRHILALQLIYKGKMFLAEIKRIFLPHAVQRIYKKNHFYWLKFLTISESLLISSKCLTRPLVDLSLSVSIPFCGPLIDLKTSTCSFK